MFRNIIINVAKLQKMSMKIVNHGRDSKNLVNRETKLSAHTAGAPHASSRIWAIIVREDRVIMTSLTTNTFCERAMRLPRAKANTYLQGRGEFF